MAEETVVCTPTASLVGPVLAHFKHSGSVRDSIGEVFAWKIQVTNGL